MSNQNIEKYHNSSCNSWNNSNTISNKECEKRC